MRLIDRVWHGDALVDRIARASLSPFALLYRGAVVLRGELYDRGVLPDRRAPISVVSVGNLTVGGTGKTPVSAWLAGRLAETGHMPAVVLRGYGADEPIVHARLNPGIPVIVSPDRMSGIAEAVAGGADVAVLDDAFQHRRASRDLDFVLVSADDWTDRHDLLPVGPFREPLEALRRASAILITRKAVTAERIAEVQRALRSVAPDTPFATVHLRLTELICESPVGARVDLNALQGKRVLAIAAVGNPAAFFRQLEALGATVVQRGFPDHHAFSRSEITELERESRSCEYVVCTLKDAVKLGPLWPAAAIPLWYVSLAVDIESGEAAIDELLMRLKGRISLR